jgi:anaerobic magnesium-protoporphyrin IX monomethyl ester cyclase
MFGLANCDILLINPPYHRRQDSGVNIPLGLGYLSSFIRSNGFSPKVIDLASLFSTIDRKAIAQMAKLLKEQLVKIRPLLAIGIGPCTLASASSIIEIQQVCARILPNVPIVYGGPLASIPGLEWFFFENLKAYAVISGDAEIVLLDLLKHLRSNDKRRVKGVSYGSFKVFSPNFVENLDELPFPARDLFDMPRYFPSLRRNLFVYPFACVVCTRGCTYKCGFCSSSSIHKGREAKRSLENISNEVKMLVSDMGVKSIIFYDDCLFSDESTVNEEICQFSKMMDENCKGVLWQIEIRTNIARCLSESSLKTMYSCGCRQLNMGIEKGTSKGLRSIGKGTTVEQSVEACENIRTFSPKMRITGTFVLGGPKETYDEAIQTVNFSKKLGLLFAHFYPLEVYPGTALYNKLFGSDMRVWWNKIRYDSEFAGSLLYEDILKKNELTRLVQYAYREFYQRQEWLDLGKKQLGDKFDYVNQIVQSWGEVTRW